MNIDYKLIGSRIKDARRSRGLTQDTLAEKLDVTVGYVSQVERGVTKINLELLAAIAEILHWNIEDFLTDSARGADSYLQSEYLSQFNLLTPKEKQLTLDFIKFLITHR